MPEERSPLLDRLLRVRALLGELRDLHREARALRAVRHRALRVGEELRQARVLTLRGAVLAKEREHAGMRGLGLAHAFEVRLRRVGATAHPPVNHRDLQRDAGLLPSGHGAALQLLVVERDQVVVHLALAEELDQARRRLLMPGRQIDHALVRGHRAFRRVQFLLQDAREPNEAGDLLFLRRCFRRELFERRGQRLPAPLLAVHALEQHRRAAVLGIDRYRFFETVDDVADERVDLLLDPLLLRLRERRAPIAVRDLGGAHEERALERHLARVLRFGDVAIDEVGPLAALRFALLDRFLGLDVARTQLEEPRVRGRAALVVEELLVEHPRELRLQLRLTRRATRQRRFDREHPRDGIVLTPHLVRATRRLEQLRQLFAVHADVAATHDVSQVLPRLVVIGVVLEKPQGAADLLRAHPSPCGLRVSKNAV